MRDVDPYVDEGLVGEVLDFERADPRKRTHVNVYRNPRAYTRSNLPAKKVIVPEDHRA